MSTRKSQTDLEGITLLFSLCLGKNLDGDDNFVFPLPSPSHKLRLNWSLRLHSEADVGRCSVKNVFLEISQNLQEKTFAGVFF